VAKRTPTEVAELGRPETPEETQARIAKARAERRGRQTVRNLVGSLVASLGVMALLIFVVVRPDTSLVETIDWEEVASQAAIQLPAAPVVPTLSPEWTSNRAEITQAAGAEIVWSVGLISADQGFVFIDQGFQADRQWVGVRTRQALSTGDVSLGDTSAPVIWVEYDRRANNSQSNYAYLLVHSTDTSTIVVGGTRAEAVTEVATAVSEFLMKEQP